MRHRIRPARTAVSALDLNPRLTPSDWFCRFQAVLLSEAPRAHSDLAHWLHQALFREVETSPEFCALIPIIVR